MISLPETLPDDPEVLKQLLAEALSSAQKLAKDKDCCRNGLTVTILFPARTAHFSYEMISWSEAQLEAVDKGAMAGSDRALYIDLIGQGATMKWLPGKDCEGDMIAAVLVGDPV